MTQSPSETYLVLGAAGGIGSDVCRLLANSGANLVLAGRTESTLHQLSAELAATSQSLVTSLDATDAAQVQAAVDQAILTFGRLDGVVNCVGSILIKPVHRTTPEEWRETLALNLDTAFAAVRAGTAAMSKTGGSIVLLSSAAARTGLPNHEAIAAAKAGVEGLARSAAATYARRGIRVNVVSPGLVRTPLAEPLLRNAASEQASLKVHALGRLGEPGDVARAITWLLSPNNLGSRGRFWEWMAA